MSTYDRFPTIAAPGQSWRGWDAICVRIAAAIAQRGSAARVIVECYDGVLDDEVLPALIAGLRPTRVLESRRAMLASSAIEALVAHDLGEDPVFGKLSALALADLFDVERSAAMRVAANGDGLVLVYGPGASVIAPPTDRDVVVYADLARWEIQLRQRRNQVANLGADRSAAQPKASLKYKRGYFVDWRLCDRQKRALWPRIDLVLDSNVAGDPKLVEGAAVRAALSAAATRPFRVVPFFDPAPWGGQWMRRVCGLDPGPANYGWCFDCVPEENSLLFAIGGARIELPAIDLVFQEPRALLGERIEARFGAEFPIRFDFLDTVGGGNLSLQVHPLNEYMRRTFGLAYTQDESYYMLDAEPGASVYLGLRDDIDPRAMLDELGAAQRGGAPFDAARHVARWPAKKHDHFLIPAGTVHCSGAGAMVLEISATPYIFTFKLWDWGRLGLDGAPRPIHLGHGERVIQWQRTAAWTKDHLVNRVEPLASGPGWREERTGLHASQFIECRRHWFSGAVAHDTDGGVNVLNLVEGSEAVVESPRSAFAPFIVHYAETFIVPAAVGAYSIRPHGAAIGTTCATMKAFVR